MANPSPTSLKPAREALRRELRRTTPGARPARWRARGVWWRGAICAATVAWWLASAAYGQWPDEVAPVFEPAAPVFEQAALPWPASSAPAASPGFESAPAAAPQQMHPAVVRIVAPGHNSMSFGSGTLIHKADDFGLVITNWHVINEATGQISVHFPDGFYSPATVQKVDQDWDLAILAIRKPNVEPVPLANEAPRPGDWLTIIGYGSGDYRAASGVCTQYVAPGETFPFEMVEVAVSARQGDSGGPMLNRRGELAGVLFGEGNGRTSGSYCGRVKWFLASVAPDAVRSSGQQLAMAPLAPVAARPHAKHAPPEPDRRAASAAQRDLASNTAATSATPVLPASIGTSGGVTTGRTVTSVPQAPVREPVVASTRGAGETAVHVIGWTDLAGETLAEQAKTVLAAIGVLALILHALRWMSTEAADA